MIIVFRIKQVCVRCNDTGLAMCHTDYCDIHDGRACGDVDRRG